MTSQEYMEKVKRLDWLRGIVNNYEQDLRLLERAGDEFVVSAIHYNYHGPATMTLNNHRTIPATFIFMGLSYTLSAIKKEIDSLELELKSVTVEL